MEKGILTIRGNRDEEHALRKTAATNAMSASAARSCDAFALPDTANGDDIEARTEHGVLHVTIPEARGTAAAQDHGQPGLTFVGAAARKKNAGCGNFPQPALSF